MGVDFKEAYKTFIQTLDDGAQPMDAENPYKFQLTKMVSLRDAKEKFNKENATVYYKPKEGAWKELPTETKSGGAVKVALLLTIIEFLMNHSQVMFGQLMLKQMHQMLFMMLQ